MAFQRPTIVELCNRIQNDLVTRLGIAGAVLRRSAIAVFARAYAGAVHTLHGHMENLSAQLFADTADTAGLERIASLLGITRLAATFASGVIDVTGSNGAGIQAGSEFQRVGDGQAYTATVDAYIASGVAHVTVKAQSAGVVGNADAATPMQLISPLLGVASAAVAGADGVSGGADAESDDLLRARVLARQRQPPNGGSAADYISWAKENAGVTRAWVTAGELGPGTVTVRFVRDGDGEGEDIIPDAGAVAQVQAYIDDDTRRPVTADVTVAAPEAAPLDVTLSITPSNADTRAAVLSELNDMINRTAAPGRTVLLSQLAVAVGAAAGVEDFTIASPAADVDFTANELPVRGTVTFT